MLLFFEYRRELSIIDNTIDVIRKGHLEGLRSAIWDLSEERIESSLKAIKADNIISDALLIYSGDDNPAFDYRIVYRAEMIPVIHPIGGKLAELWILITRSDLTSIIFRNTRFYLFVLIPILFMAAAIMLLFRLYVTNPLRALTKYTKEISIENIQNDFPLPERRGFNSENELGLLLNAITQMRLNIKNEDNQRKKAEKLLGDLQKNLEDILNSIPSLIIGIDMDGLVTLWNREAEIATGIGNKMAVGKKLTEVIPRLESIEDTIHAVSRNKETRRESLYFQQKDGSEIYEEVIISPLKSRKREGIVLRIDDITEKRKLDEIMVQNEKMLSIGGLAAGIAHEINNPLAGMLQSASVLSNRLGISRELSANVKAAEECGISPESINQYLEKRDIPRILKSITEGGQRVAEIVQNMLSFARQSDRKRSTFSINNLIDDTLSLISTEFSLKNHYDFKKIKIDRQFGEGIPPVICERSKIQQVILNILQNRAQAMYSVDKIDHQPIFTIRTCFAEYEKLVRVEIEDNGPGMEKNIEKRIFEPFFTTKAEGKGTGLGLSVSYYIIKEDHKGNLSVSSTPGKGTIFTIELPA